MRLSVRGLIFIAVLSGVFFLFSCVSDPDTSGPGPDPQESGPAAEEPDWVVKYPVDPDYFIGVGSSNTGDRGKDMDAARLDALAALSSSIVTKIEAEIVIDSSDDTEGNSYSRITQRIKENVAQNLKGVEPVDSFYSEKDGYWFYFRFPKAELQKMKEDLTERVLTLTGPAIESGYPSVAEGLGLLWDGYTLIQDSPFVGTIDAEVGEYTGALTDILQKELSRLSASLDIQAGPKEMKIEQGQTPEVMVQVENNLGIPSGQFHVLLLAEGKKSAELVTGRDGAYAGKIDLTDLPMGRTMCVWTLDFSELGIRGDSARLFTPETSIFTEVSRKSVGLEADTGTGEPFQGLYQSVSSLFSDNLSFDISEEPKRTNIMFTLHFRDLPENDFGIFFTFARAVVSVRQEGKTLFSWESDEFKEGGLNTQQGRERAKASLFEALAGESELFRMISDSVIEK